jgi:thiol-disulfide isomerase/thioredoxin
MVVHGIGVVLLGVSLLAVPPDLSIGDPAPDLSIANWIKGEAVDLSELKGEKIAVIEFWATWCGPCKKSIPHLTELQNEYREKGVVIIGISTEDDLGKIQGFVEEWGDKMDYTVAQDDNRKTFDAWMKAAGENGIPCAFVVDKEGEVAWIGHPTRLDIILKAIVAGAHSTDEEIEKREEEKRRQREMRANRYKLAEMQTKFQTLIQAGKLEDAGALGEKIHGILSGNAMLLNNFAWELMTEEPYKGKFDKLALKMAEEANELAEGGSWYVLDTLALGRFLHGDCESAVELEKKAILLAKRQNVPEEQVAELEAALKRFSAKKKKRWY